MATYVIHKETKQPTKLIGTPSMDLLLLDIFGEWRRESSMILIRSEVVVQVQAPWFLKYKSYRLEKTWLSTISPTPSYYLRFVIFISPKLYNIWT
jgi:hypothetical protein